MVGTDGYAPSTPRMSIENRPSWKNYGIEYKIKPTNYIFDDIPLNLDKEILEVRDKIYFGPNFIKKTEILFKSLVSLNILS